MAFNPFTGFQRNRRFWMAAILMVCMVSFVFCTGMRGDLSDRILNALRPRGSTIAVVGGRSVTLSDLDELKTQRELANDIMIRCADAALRNLSKIWFELNRKPAGDKEAINRRQALAQIEAMRISIDQRKNKPRYFDSGTKFDELMEFKLWQAQADRMGIHLEEDHVNFLFREEFYSNGRDRILTEEDIVNAQWAARGNMGERVTRAFINRAISEEFRVRIAQYAVLGAQPFSYLERGRGKKKDEPQVGPKYTFPEVSDEIRTPLTLAQLWDYYKKKRSEFDVTLMPFPVKDFLKDVPEPKEADQDYFFNQHKNKPADPSSPDWGLDLPPRVKIEYLIADPTAPEYINPARAKGLVEAFTPLVGDPMQSPVTIAARYMGTAQADKYVLTSQYEAQSQAQYRLAAPFTSPDHASPILMWAAKRHPQAGVSALGLAAADPYAALAGYVAWGTTKEDAADVNAALSAEAQRRIPAYATLFASSTSGVPLEMAALYLGMDKYVTVRREILPGFEFDIPERVYPALPVEAVQKEIRNIVANRIAEEWARRNINTVREQLDKTNSDPAKFKRALNKTLPGVQLTHGPANKDQYFDRYSIMEAKEFEPLREAFNKYIDTINMAEGRDLTPARILKPGDFWKMFFPASEEFTALTAYRAMPWPPISRPNNVRMWKPGDPRLINEANLNKGVMDDLRQFMLNEQLPNQAVQKGYDLFKYAQKPILYWRSGLEVSAAKPGDYSRVNGELKEYAELLTQIEHDIAKTQDASKLLQLREKKVETQRKYNDLREIQRRVIEGWKFENARLKNALPKAKNKATELIDRANDPSIIESVKNRIVLRKVSQMHPELLPSPMIDYFDYSIPKEQKDQIEFPRDDMAQQIVSLYDLKQPIKISQETPPRPIDEELDKINEALFKRFEKENFPQGKFVQILTNKPRSVFYVAVVSGLPQAGHNERVDFARTIIGAPLELTVRPRKTPMADTFLARAQQHEAQRRRAEIINDLKKALEFDLKDESARAKFERREAD